MTFDKTKQGLVNLGIFFVIFCFSQDNLNNSTEQKRGCSKPGKTLWLDIIDLLPFKSQLF